MRPLQVQPFSFRVKLEVKSNDRIVAIPHSSRTGNYRKQKIAVGLFVLDLFLARGLLVVVGFDSSVTVSI